MAALAKVLFGCLEKGKINVIEYLWDSYSSKIHR